MSTPAYHLRTNKAVDRFIFLDALRCLGKKTSIEKYVYYGFGGAYLEDFRLVHENFPNMKMVSIEEDTEVYKRQEFHRPSKNINLVNKTSGDFLASEYDPKNKKSIFWLDYTKLRYSNVDEFMTLLQRAPIGSVIKITLPVQPSHYQKDEQVTELKDRFKEVWPDSYTTIPPESMKFSKLLQEMLQIASQKALPSRSGAVFQPLSSFFYKDGLGIFTLTGIKCIPTDIDEIKKDFSGWKFSNLDWQEPKLIDVPVLSSKERLHLQKRLPSKSKKIGESLVRFLGYEIESDAAEKLSQYAQFYVQYPYFIRAAI